MERVHVALPEVTAVVGSARRRNKGKTMSVLITREMMAANTAERFRQQYGPDFGVYPFGDSGEILRQLLALGPTPTVQQVEILCPGWTLLDCDECGEKVDQVVQVGQEPDYESATACICWRCATNAVALFNLP